jgi:hypothetical protein
MCAIIYRVYVCVCMCVYACASPRTTLHVFTCEHAHTEWSSLANRRSAATHITFLCFCIDVSTYINTYIYSKKTPVHTHARTSRKGARTRKWPKSILKLRESLRLRRRSRNSPVHTAPTCTHIHTCAFINRDIDSFIHTQTHIHAIKPLPACGAV